MEETPALKAYRELVIETDQKIALLDWNDGSRASEAKWAFIDQLNAAWDALTKEDRQSFVGALDHGKGFALMNAAYDRSRFHKKEIEKGVYGRDLIQPLNPDGKPNPEFVEHYGIANYTPEQKEYIAHTMGRDKNRERDWRSEKR